MQLKKLHPSLYSHNDFSWIVCIWSLLLENGLIPIKSDLVKKILQHCCTSSCFHGLQASCIPLIIQLTICTNALKTQPFPLLWFNEGPSLISLMNLAWLHSKEQMLIGFWMSPTYPTSTVNVGGKISKFLSHRRLAFYKHPDKQCHALGCSCCSIQICSIFD